MADYNCQPIWHTPSAVRVVYADAIDTGYGGYVVEHGDCVAYGQWTEHEAQQSSTWRELTAVLRVLMAVVDKLKNFPVRWFTDNQNVARILLVGSKKPLLQVVALKVFSLAVQNHIRLEPEWIPRDLNEKADYLSRIIDYDDWQLHPSLFSVLDNLWGPHSVDRFASFHNCQLPRFNSRCWNPGSEAVDAFTVNCQEKITGCVPQLAWSLELFTMLRLVGQRDPWSYHGGLLQHFGLCCVPLIQVSLQSLLERLGSCHR